MANQVNYVRTKDQRRAIGAISKIGLNVVNEAITYLKAVVPSPEKTHDSIRKVLEAAVKEQNRGLSTSHVIIHSGKNYKTKALYVSNGALDKSSNSPLLINVGLENDSSAQFALRTMLPKGSQRLENRYGTILEAYMNIIERMCPGPGGFTNVAKVRQQLIDELNKEFVNSEDKVKIPPGLFDCFGVMPRDDAHRPRMIGSQNKEFYADQTFKVRLIVEFPEICDIPKQCMWLGDVVRIQKDGPASVYSPAHAKIYFEPHPADNAPTSGTAISSTATAVSTSGTRAYSSTATASSSAAAASSSVAVASSSAAAAPSSAAAASSSAAVASSSAATASSSAAAAPSSATNASNSVTLATSSATAASGASSGGPVTVSLFEVVDGKPTKQFSSAPNSAVTIRMSEGTYKAITDAVQKSGETPSLPAADDEKTEEARQAGLDKLRRKLNFNREKK